MVTIFSLIVSINQSKEIHEVSTGVKPYRECKRSQSTSLF